MKEIFAQLTQSGNSYLKHSQSAVAKALGLPDRGVDGSIVYPLYKAGRFVGIENYCMGDVRELKNIHQKLGYSKYAPMPF